MPAMTGPEPSRDCDRCPRLVEFRMRYRAAEPTWHNAPVPTFAAKAPRLLIVGLAPGLRGANRTGRPFTGDYAGDLLYETLTDFGFATGRYAADPADGLQLAGAAIANAVRCVPPENKPTPAEMTACRPYLSATLDAMPTVEVLVALGRIAHEQVLRALGLRLAAHSFAHGAVHALAAPDGRPLALFDSYHCSRYNTNTGVLTRDMFRAVFAEVKARLAQQS